MKKNPSKSGKRPETSMNLASFIDHTLLKPDATAEAIDKLCKETIEYRFATVCVNPVHVSRAVENMKDSGIPVTSVVGFPLGANSWEIKAAETRDAISRGAGEIDMVINIGALKDGNYQEVFRDIEAVVKAASGRPVKVILETALLTNDQKVAACILAKAAGAAFVKTSTGFGPAGATVEDVALMRSVVGPEMGVKASGGIRDAATARAMIAAGASRLGASASIAIIKG
ncbi:MAG: deoxyribose-phosphate aldolase [bacterium]